MHTTSARHNRPSTHSSPQPNSRQTNSQPKINSPRCCRTNRHLSIHICIQSFTPLSNHAINQTTCSLSNPAQTQSFAQTIQSISTPQTRPTAFALLQSPNPAIGTHARNQAIMFDQTLKISKHAHNQSTFTTRKHHPTSQQTCRPTISKQTHTLHHSALHSPITQTDNHQPSHKQQTTFNHTITNPLIHSTDKQQSKTTKPPTIHAAQRSSTQTFVTQTDAVQSFHQTPMEKYADLQLKVNIHLSSIQPLAQHSTDTAVKNPVHPHNHPTSNPTSTIHPSTQTPSKPNQKASTPTVHHTGTNHVIIHSTNHPLRQTFANQTSTHPADNQPPNNPLFFRSTTKSINPTNQTQS